MHGVSDDDFDFQLQNCLASVLIVLMDTIHTTEKTQLREAQNRRAQLMVRLFRQKDIWTVQPLIDARGAFLFRKNCVEGSPKLRMEMEGVFRYASANVHLQEGTRIP